MTERLLIAFGTWVAVGTGLSLCRRMSPLHFFVLLLVATGLIGTFYPLASLLVEPLTWRNIGHLDDETIQAVELDYMVFAWGMLLAAFIAASKGWLVPDAPAEQVARRSWVRYRDGIVAPGLLFSGAMLYGLYVHSVGISALTNKADYAEKYLLSTGLGPLSFGLWMMILGCLWAEASQMPSRHKLAYRGAALAIGIWSIVFISVRTNAVVLLMGYLHILAGRRGIELRRIRISLVVVLILAYIGLEGFSLYRGTTSRSAGEAIEIIMSRGETTLASVVGGSELSHPFITAVEVAASREPAELAGRSYLDGFLVLMPRFINPDRPLALSQEFVQTYYAWAAARGGGTAFSMLAEAWLNFGPILGAGFVGFAIGLLMLAVERHRATHRRGVLARLAPYLVFIVVVIHRNESASILKFLFASGVVVTGMCIAAQLVWSFTLRVRGGDVSGGLSRPGSDPRPPAPAGGSA